MVQRGVVGQLPDGLVGEPLGAAVPRPGADDARRSGSGPTAATDLRIRDGRETAFRAPTRATVSSLASPPVPDMVQARRVALTVAGPRGALGRQ